MLLNVNTGNNIAALIYDTLGLQPINGGQSSTVEPEIEILDRQENSKIHELQFTVRDP